MSPCRQLPTLSTFFMRTRASSTPICSGNLHFRVLIRFIDAGNEKLEVRCRVFHCLFLEVVSASSVPVLLILPLLSILPVLTHTDRHTQTRRHTHEHAHQNSEINCNFRKQFASYLIEQNHVTSKERRRAARFSLLCDTRQ